MAKKNDDEIRSVHDPVRISLSSAHSIVAAAKDDSQSEPPNTFVVRSLIEDVVSNLGESSVAFEQFVAVADTREDVGLPERFPSRSWHFAAAQIVARVFSAIVNPNGCVSQIAGVNRSTGEIELDATKLAEWWPEIRKQLQPLTRIRFQRMRDLLVQEFCRATREAARRSAQSGKAYENPDGSVFELTDRSKPKQSMTWRQVRDAALKYLRTEGKPWPGANALARSLGCSPSTLRTACKRDAELARIKAEYEAKILERSVSARQMSDAVRDSITAADDVEELGSDESDDLIASLKAECVTPEAEKWFASLPEADRLAAAILKRSDPETGQDTRSRRGHARAQ